MGVIRGNQNKPNGSNSHLRMTAELQKKKDPFLERIVSGDEKWVSYNNVKRKRSW